LRSGGVLARFGSDGLLQTTAVLGRVAVPATARIIITGPQLAGLPRGFGAAYARATERVSAGAVRLRVRPLSAVRAILRLDARRSQVRTYISTSERPACLLQGRTGRSSTSPVRCGGAPATRSRDVEQRPEPGWVSAETVIYRC
jgi:hypothetical protein